MNINKILFLRLSSPDVYRAHPRNLLPPLQLGYMISLVKNNYEVHFIDCRITSLTIDEIAKKTLDFNPDLIVSTFFTYDYRYAMRFFNEIKKEINPLILCIGHHASCAPRSLIFEGSPVDYLLLGECELDFVKFLEYLETNEYLEKINSLFSLKKKDIPKPAMIENLDSLPFPRHELFNSKFYRSVYPLKIKKRIEWGYMLSTRGCPYDCIFCSQSVRESYGKKFRIRSPKNVVDEMKFLMSLGKNVISFIDDCFTVSKKYVEDVCDEIIKRKLDVNWICHARIDNLSKEMMKKMKQAGCLLLKIGVESGSNRIIEVLKKTPNKLDWSDLTRKIFKFSKEVNLPILSMFILGSPTETMKDIKKTLALIEDINSDLLQICYFTPYPGSEAFLEYFNGTDFDENFYHYKPFINVSNMNFKELELLSKKIYRSFYFRPRFLLKHLRNHFLFYSLNPSYAKSSFILL
jgi:radical SAM superfamily enzyme YgiQ (UPF0313 family)